MFGESEMICGRRNIVYNELLDRQIFERVS